jgi:hypothetical protein
VPITLLRPHAYRHIGRSGDVSSNEVAIDGRSLSLRLRVGVDMFLGPLDSGGLPDPNRGPDHEVRCRAGDVAAGCDRLAGHLSTVMETRSPSPKSGSETGANDVEIIVVM